MVLGCLICREPLAAEPKLLFNKTDYLRGQPRRTAGAVNSERPQPCPTDECALRKCKTPKERQLLLAKCGHLFHKHCLRDYISYHSKIPLTRTAGRECPFCYQRILFGGCVDAHLNIPPNDALAEKVQMLDSENQQLHGRLLHGRLKLEGYKADIEKLTKETRKVNKARGKQDDMLNSEDLVPNNSVRIMRDGVSKREKYKSYLTKQNDYLFALLKQQTEDYYIIDVPIPRPKTPGQELVFARQFGRQLLRFEPPFNECNTPASSSPFVSDSDSLETLYFWDKKDGMTLKKVQRDKISKKPMKTNPFQDWSTVHSVDSTEDFTSCSGDEETESSE